MLRSKEDCSILYRIVRSPLSAWLAEHITELRFNHDHLPGYSLWTALVRILPACRDVQHRFDAGPGRMSHSAALKSSLQSITFLLLDNCTFPSFRILLRILADITRLEAITFRNIQWSDDRLLTADAARNTCTGAFSRVRSVKMETCTNNLAVPAWILAATSTRHSFTRRQAAGPAVPAETWTIIEFIQTFLGESTIQSSRFDVKEATLGEPDLSRY